VGRRRAAPEVIAVAGELTVLRDAEMEQIAWANWRRVLEAAWG